MIAAELHGTPAGHAAGCRGYQCLHHRTDQMTCEQAKRLYDSDYGYRKAIDAGLPWPPPPAPKPDPAPVIARAPKKTPAPKKAAAPRLTAAGRPSRAMPPEQRKRKLRREHGTMSRYKGSAIDPKCTTDEECPHFGVPGEITCRQANLNYAADIRRKMAEDPEFFASRTHGTSSTYSMGCANPARCPNNGVDGKETCSEARARAVKARAPRAAEARKERARTLKQKATA